MSLKPATDYFSEDYLADFELLGSESMCGFNLMDMMSEPKRSRFRGFPEFALCQFALNLHNQAIYAHFRQLHFAWRGYVAPFGNTLLCFSGHGLGSHSPNAILRFVQAPLDRALAPGRYEWTDVANYVRYFFGGYLAAFVATLPGTPFTPEEYIATLAGDYDCRASIITDSGWESRNVTSLLLASANERGPSALEKV